MWSICRVDNRHPDENDPNTCTLFEVQAAYRKRDLDINAARLSGFVADGDELVIVSPSGQVREI